MRLNVQIHLSTIQVFNVTYSDCLQCEHANSLYKSFDGNGTEADVFPNVYNVYTIAKYSMLLLQ